MPTFLCSLLLTISILIAAGSPRLAVAERRTAEAGTTVTHVIGGIAVQEATIVPVTASAVLLPKRAGLARLQMDNGHNAQLLLFATVTEWEKLYFLDFNFIFYILHLLKNFCLELIFLQKCYF